MFHVKQTELVLGFLSELGRSASEDQLERLDGFGLWLAAEAAAAGGIGPNEIDSVWERHIVDSLVYLAGMTATPRNALDIGSGVGLPGIPLAILLPEVAFTLLDRSGRRVGLMRRALRILQLDNVSVLQRDIVTVSGQFDLVTSRASLPPDQLLPYLRRLVSPEGCGVIGASTVQIRHEAGYETREIRSMFLDRPRWLLIMQPS